MFEIFKHKDREKDDRDRDRDQNRERERLKKPPGRSGGDRDREKRKKRSSRQGEDGRKTPTSPVMDRPDRPDSSSSRRRRGTKTKDDDENGDRTHDVPLAVGSLRDEARESKTSLPYPTFSKAHSRESILPSVSPKKDIEVPTPDATEVGKVTDESIKRPSENGIVPNAPPSPPLTSVEENRTNDVPALKPVEEVKKTEGISRPSSRSSKLNDERIRGHGRTASQVSKASTARRNGKDFPQSPTKSRTPKPGPAEEDKIPQNITPPRAGSSIMSGGTDDVESNADSQATSKARFQPPPPPPPVPGGLNLPFISTASVSNNQTMSPLTPTQPLSPFMTPIERDVGHDLFYNIRSPVAPFSDSPQPPPPPPPPMVPSNAPRVDYLLQNGGLPTPISRTLLATSQPSIPNTLAHPHMGRPPAPTIAEVERIFAPYHGKLDQFQAVLSKNGSLAVATGYKSVARKLLDRLENVFARDISSEECPCAICKRKDQTEVEQEEKMGWGEVLELVNGRIDLPSWPVFDFGSLNGPQPEAGLGIGRSATPGIAKKLGMMRTATPLQQNIDSDVPEEFRSHYIRQSQKMKKTVDRWLMSQPALPSSPPREVDDETLSFAILTHLDSDDRPLYTALLAAPSARTTPQDSRAPTPLLKTRSDLLVKTALAIQRLYRFPRPPRDPECAIFLLKHPSLHKALATVAAISVSEWEVLVSGRFDGFLWSGADGAGETSPLSRGTTPLMRGPSRGPKNLPSRGAYAAAPQSRGPTPFNSIASMAASRGQTPANGASPTQGNVPLGAPIPYDEETEIATLAEIEREIYVGMEVLEDAFEALHRKAEVVRRLLRERGAGLSMGGQGQRANGGGGGIEVVANTPGLEWLSEASETDEGESPSIGMDVRWENDSVSELAPDDSASNISSSRHRRPKRRNERRTPAPVEEESEDGL